MRMSIRKAVSSALRTLADKVEPTTGSKPMPPATHDDVKAASDRNDYVAKIARESIKKLADSPNPLEVLLSKIAEQSIRVLTK